MKFPDVLLAAIERASGPLGIDPEEAEALAGDVHDLLWKWIASHLPGDGGDSEFDAGYRALVAQLLAELEGSAILPE